MLGRIFIAAVFFFAAAYGAQAADFVVIANKNGPLVKADKFIIRDIFLGERQFAGGVKLIPINYAEGRIKDEFVGAITGMNSREYRLHWAKKVFQEGGSMPPSVDSVLEIAEMVRREKGAVAFVPAVKLGEMTRLSADVVVIWP